MRNFADTLAAIRTGEGGRLSVGAVSTAKYFAPKLIAAFVASRPKVDLRFLIGNRDATIDWLRVERSRDRALRSSAPRHGGRDGVAGTSPLCPRCAAGPSSCAPEGLSRADLAGETFLIREPGSGTRSLFESLLRRDRRPAGETGHGARLERIDQAGGDGGTRDRAPFRPYHRRRNRKRAARPPRRRGPADRTPVVRHLPDRSLALADRARVPGFRRAGRRTVSTLAGTRRRKRPSTGRRSTSSVPSGRRHAALSRSAFRFLGAGRRAQAVCGPYEPLDMSVN